MSKFQPPMLNDDVCRAHTYTQTYIQETFFMAIFFYFSFSICLKVKKWRFPIFFVHIWLYSKTLSIIMQSAIPYGNFWTSWMFIDYPHGMSKASKKNIYIYIYLLTPFPFSFNIYRIPNRVRSENSHLTMVRNKIGKISIFHIFLTKSQQSIT